MTYGIARLGDTSSHNGYIMSVPTTRSFVDGKPVATIGSIHSCPIPGHGDTPIISSPVDIMVEGMLCATLGSVAQCGAVINSASLDTTS